MACPRGLICSWEVGVSPAALAIAEVADAPGPDPVISSVTGCSFPPADVCSFPEAEIADLHPAQTLRYQH